MNLLILTVLCLTISVNAKICKHTLDLLNGTILTSGKVELNGIAYRPGDDLIENGRVAEKGCKCGRKRCFRKCCPPGYGFDLKTKNCKEVLDKFNPPVWSLYYKKTNKHVDMFNPLYGIVTCREDEIRLRVGKVSPEFYIRTNGKLFISTPNNKQRVPFVEKSVDDYCMDTFLADGPNGSVATLDALVCFNTEPDEQKNYATSAFMLISSVFILATLAVYAWLPELRNLHGQVLMAYLSSLLAGFLSMASMQLLLASENIGINGCAGLAIVIYYTLLSAFFWLNVMCFDIYWTFSGNRGLALRRLSVHGRFYAYAAYAYICPLVLTAIFVGLEFSGLPPGRFMPMLRLQGCFLSGDSKLLYFYGPILVLCTANIVFFFLTALKIAQVKQQTAVLKSKESSTHDSHRNDRQRLALYLKLFCVMGVSWILEVLSTFYPDAYWFWMFTDAYNVLVGVVIFIIFVCKRKIFRLIKKRYKQLKGETSMSRSQTTTTRTSTRDDQLRMDNIKNTDQC